MSKINNFNRAKWINKRYTILLPVAIIFTIFGFIYNNRTMAQTKSPTIVKNIGASDLFTVKIGNLDQVVEFTGDLSPLLQTNIASQANSQLLQILALPGQYVTKNQVLAYLNTTNAQQELNQAKTDLATSKINLNLTLDKYKRYQELESQGFVAKVSMNQYQADYDSAMEDVDNKQSSVKLAEKLLSDCTIRAPFDGVIFNKFVNQGSFVDSGTIMFALVNLDTLEITTSISTNQIDKLKVGQPVEFQENSNSKKYTGAITRINPIPELNTHSYLVYVDFDNRKYQLRVGQYIKGDFIISSMQNANIIPTETLRKDQNEYYVFALEHSKVIKRKITLLASNSNNSAVIGVSAKEVVISHNVVNINMGMVISNIY